MSTRIVLICELVDGLDSVEGEGISIARDLLSPSLSTQLIVRLIAIRSLDRET